MPPPPNMSRATGAAVALALMFILQTPVVMAQTTQERSGEVVDVMMFDAACLNESRCDLTRPDHLVEYFAADWCEPCYEVSPLVNSASSTEVLVIQHPSSPADQAYVSLSNQRFEQDYRLVFYPSIVVDGAALLTGSRQALDLNIALNNSTTEWGGMENIRVENGTLSIEGGGLEGHRLTMWVTQPTLNTAGNLTHTHLASRALTINTSQGSLNLTNLSLSSNGTVVLMLESEGPKRLTVASLAPTGSMDLIGPEEPEDIGARDDAPWLLPALIGTALIIALAPAMLMHRRLMNHEPLGESE